MEKLERQDTLDYEENLGKGFSKDQILQFTLRDIEDLYFMEHPGESPADKKQREEEIVKEKQKDYKDPNDGGPRPPKEEEYPEDVEEEDDPLSETSDPNKKD
jgi:hypothetical protein